MNSPSEREQVLWRRLAVFGGTFSLEAAEAICAGQVIEKGEVAALLARLVEKGLVGFERQGKERRYQLSEPQKQEAQERLNASGEAQTIQEYFADYYVALAEQSRREMFGTLRSAWMDRLEGEAENLRAALRWLAQRGEAERGLRLAVGLREFWWGGDHLTEGREWLTRLLALPQAAEQTALRAQALDDAGALAYCQSDYSAAGALGEESLAVRRGLGDRHGIAVSLIHQGVNARDQDDYTTARVRFEESLGIMRELDSRHGIIYSLCGLASVALDEGNYAAARPLLKEILPTLRDLGDLWAMSFQLDEFAGVAVGEGQPERALRLAGAGAALREGVSVALPPDYQAKLDRRLEPARKALDKAAQAAAWEAGWAMTLDQAVTYALEEAAADATAQ